ncbi:MAG TPA: hypothetical protein VIJ20_08705 [Solirubrobacteraceae bacterium]
MVFETNAWKVLLLVGLLATIVMSLCWSAPRRSVARSDLYGLVLAGVCLYAVGGLALFLHHRALAGLVFAGGIVICALAVWLSRGVDAEDPPPDDERPADDPTPPGPDGLPELDWDQFEVAFRAYAARERAGSA